MRLYLVRHGEAVPKEQDPRCPLSDRGREDVRRVAAFLARAGVRVTHILHSGKPRAEETAALLAEKVGPGVAFQKVDGLAPLDPVNGLAYQVKSWNEDLMVVGHLPFMARLVSRLVTGDNDTLALGFPPGTVACLERVEDTWFLLGLVGPHLIPAPKD